MIDTQQQYIKLNIRGEISIIVVQAQSGRKGDICIETYIHLLTYIWGGGEGDEREHIHIYQVIHHQSARDILSRC